MAHNALKMALVVAAMNAEFGTPRGAAERAGATALILLENVARRAHAERRGASVRRADETPKEKDAKDRRKEGGAFSTRGGGRPHQRARLGSVGGRALEQAPAKRAA